jgi:hypothetical protein
MFDIDTGDISIEAESPNKGHPERCDCEHWFSGPLIYLGHWLATRSYWAKIGERNYRHIIWTESGRCLGCGKHWRELCKTPAQCSRTLKDLKVALPCHICGEMIRKPRQVEVNRQGQYAHASCVVS